MLTFSPTHAETLARAGLDHTRAAAILSAQAFGETLCQHMSAPEIEAVRNVWLSDGMPRTWSFRDTVVRISKMGPRAPLATLDVFTRAYIECALWSSVSDDEGGISASHTVDDLAPETRATMCADCAAFQKAADSTLYALWDAGIGQGTLYASAGQDFWLTRNGHGAGFWDGDWPEPQATQLDALAQTFPNVDLYVGDDRRIYS